MIYTKYQNEKLSLLGFGCMRLPVDAAGAIDEAQVERMVAYAMEHGVNYFDTAYPYHGGMSEVVMGRVLSKYPRESYNLADKYPGHQISASYDPKAIFEEQLEKCGVEYFDYYLLHNVYENSIDVYMDPKWGILDYFREQRKLGRIRHLGFSTHGRPETIKKFLDYCGGDMEFCQIQLNYLDWNLQKAKAKYELLAKHNIPVWVMEPVRGGKLVNLSDEHTAMLKALRPDETPAAWCFRFLQGLDNVQMILSGMSNEAQMIENIDTFEERKPLNVPESEAVFQIADVLGRSIPCTACRYCCDGCPAGLDIPWLLNQLNDLRFAAAPNTAMQLESMPQDKLPSACLTCGKCVKICPQNIEIPALMKELTERFNAIPRWAQVCKEREEIARRNRKK